MSKLLAASLFLTMPMVAGAQTITNPVTNPNSTSPGSSIAVPRVGENVDDATRATQRTQKADTATPGPTTLRDRERAAKLHRKHAKDGGPD